MLFCLSRIIFFSTLMIAAAAQAEDVCSRLGPITECGEGKLSHLDVAGKVTLRGTNVLGNTHIAGILKASNATLNDLELAGKVKLVASQVQGAARISGLLVSCNSNFSHKLNVSSDYTRLEKTTLPAIRISAGGHEQVLYLANNSFIKGDVTFESGHGMVLVDQTSQVVGRVKGGYINYSDINTIC